MLAMDQIHHIRQMFYEQGKNISEISAETGLNWKTVKKYVDMEDFSSPPPVPEKEVTHDSKLDQFRPLIDSWLEEDKKAPRKQRHTAKRIFNRLKAEAEGFSCSYRLVASYVARKKKELRLSRQEGYIPLIHRPGEAQADFGTADFYENGHHYRERKYLVLSFPFSNGGYLQLNYGENTECLLEGLRTIFEHIGGVPTEIWFDNTRTIVTDIIKGGGRSVTERFSRFAEHYRFKPVFMNPESGWEKGSVENKTGSLRRNELVPVPRFPSLQEKNRSLLDACDRDMGREHYDDTEGRLISEIYSEDRKAFLKLPAVRFDTDGYTSARTDKYGRFTLDDGKHRYSASPAFPETEIQVRLTSSSVTAMDADMHEIVTHRRLYGDDEPESMDWLPYLKYIARKPRSLFNSGIYDLMPEVMQKYMIGCGSTDRGKILKVLSNLTDRTGFDSAVRTVEEAIRYQTKDPESLGNLYRRLYSDVPALPPLDAGMNIPLGKIIPFNDTDLSRLDTVLEGGAVHG